MITNFTQLVAKLKYTNSSQSKKKKKHNVELHWPEDNNSAVRSLLICKQSHKVSCQVSPRGH